MPLGNIKSSTQDNSSGTPVATATNEDSVTNALQAQVPVGNKSTYSEVSRTGITTADTSTTDLSTSGFAGTAGANLGNAGNALSLEIRATCDTSGKTLIGRLIFYDASNNPLSVGPSVTFTSDGALRVSSSGNYVCPRQIVDCGQARQFEFYIDSISGGTWNVYVRPV